MRTEKPAHPSDQLQPVLQRIREYCSMRPEITACYLYGSYATGKNRPGSDLDLAFLFAQNLDTRRIDQLRADIIVELGRLTRLDIHLLVMNTAGELVLGQIFAKAICLYQRNAVELRAFCSKKMPMIAEFAYYVEMMRTKLAARYGDYHHG